MPTFSVDSVKALIAGSALIVIGGVLLFVRPEAETAATTLIGTGVGVLAPGAFRLGSGK